MYWNSMLLCYQYDPFHNLFPYRTEAIFFVVIAIALIAWLYIRPIKWMPHRVRKFLLVFCLAMLPLATCFIFVPKTFYDQLRSTIVYRYQAWVEPNYLNRMARFYERNLDIVLPTAGDGVIIADKSDTDITVEVDKNGRISINNATLSLSMLQMIISNRISKFGVFRVIIWADKDAPVETRGAMVKALRNFGCNSIFFVVSAPPSRKMTVEYKAIPWPAEQYP